ncbi:hypothetical protein Tsubulata_050720, partial [Turnera subulata]
MKVKNSGVRPISAKNWVATSGYSSSKPKAARRTKEHYIHPDHLLALFNCKHPKIYCTLCGDPIAGAGYGCCECRVYLHESCAELTQEIRHPYHGKHPLRAYKPSGVEKPHGLCVACRASLHSSCAAKSLFAPPMKHERHEHWIHYEDPLINWSPVVSDDPGAEATKQIQPQNAAPVDFDELKRKPHCQRQIQIEDFSNNHVLTIHQYGEHNRSRIVCDACDNQVLYSSSYYARDDNQLPLTSSYYTCEFCNLHYHKLCAELPRSIRHPLHSLHPLLLHASD